MRWGGVRWCTACATGSHWLALAKRHLRICIILDGREKPPLVVKLGVGLQTAHEALAQLYFLAQGRKVGGVLLARLPQLVLREASRKDDEGRAATKEEVLV